MADNPSADPSAPAGAVRCANCGQANRVPAVAAGVPACASCHRPLPWITDAGEGDFAEVVERAGLPVLVDMWATWCPPCRMVSPALEQLAAERAGSLKLVKVDVDTAPGLAQRFAVRAVPTLMVMRDGKVLARQAGASSLPALRNWLDGAIGERDTGTS